ncbi:hypothetical protein FAIPA1_20403 [Frankia sp. AiPs1]
MASLGVACSETGVDEVQVETAGRSSAPATVVERDGDLVLVVRDGAIPGRAVLALRAVLAPVVGRIVGRTPR